MTKIEDVQKMLLSSSPIIDLEITTRCNKSCRICPREKLERRNIDMDNRVFDKIVNWLPSDCIVLFAGIGEPIMNNNIFNYIKILTHKNIKTSLITNGLLLTEKKIELLFGSGLDRLQISYILNENKYSIANILEKFLHKIRRNIHFNFISDIDVDESTISENTKLINSYGYTSTIKQTHSRGGDYFKPNSKINSSCGTFFKVIFVNVFGEIHICSNDFNNKFPLGNINITSFSELLEIKRKYIGKNFNYSVCRLCTDEYRYKHLNLNENETHFINFWNSR
jgi:MoaA/NifB/PqqE/SkfB family radical SAM enzyme